MKPNDIGEMLAWWNSKVERETKMPKYFKKREFDCKCGCGLNNIDPTLVSMLDSAREEAGIPMVIASGCRCPAYNLQEGGKENSDHLTGEGADIKAMDSHTRFIILSEAMKAGFKRIGVAKTFIHLGIKKENPQEVFWLY